MRQLDPEKWTKVKLPAERRLQRPNVRQSKYWAVCSRLLNELSDTYGYYLTCSYHTVTVVHKEAAAAAAADKVINEGLTTIKESNCTSCVNIIRSPRPCLSFL